MFFHPGRSGAHWRHRNHRHHHPGHGHGHDQGRGRGGRGSGIRRPLRFLIDRLELSDEQAGQLGRILENRKLEREQADLDRRKAQARLADLFEAEPLDTQALQEAAQARVSAAERERDAAVEAVVQLHALLTPGQRARLATLVRGGPFTL